MYGKRDALRVFKAKISTELFVLNYDLSKDT